jgi:hypothetical protein
VRSATTVVAYAHGYVLAGRSLRVVEERESALTNWVILAWFGMVVCSGLAAMIGVWAANWAGRSNPARSKSAA